MNIIYISLVDWFWIKQRPQHFTEILSRNGNEIHYLSVISWRDNQKFGVRKVLKILRSKEKIEINKNLNVIRKKIFPLEGKFKGIRKINSIKIKKNIERIYAIKKIDIIILTHPRQLEYIPKELMKKCKIIYDCMDDYENFNIKQKRLVAKFERELVGQADAVIVSSQYLKNKIKNKYKNILKYKRIELIENGVDLENFNLKKLEVESENFEVNIDSQKLNLVYVGTVASWLDVDTILYVAKNRSDIVIHIVGPIENGIERFEEIKKSYNIVVWGKRKYNEVPYILKKMDIALMPFVINDLIKAVNPVKIYEYLALGMPVISISYNETEKFKEYIYLYKNKEEFLECIDKCLNNKFDYSRVKFAEMNTWKSRVEKLNNILKEC